MNLSVLLFAAALLLDGAVLLLSLFLRRFSFRVFVPPVCLTMVSVFLLLFSRPVSLCEATLFVLFPAASLMLCGNGEREPVSGYFSWITALSLSILLFLPVGKMVLFPAVLLVLSRILSALARLRHPDASARDTNYYTFSLFSICTIEEMLWFFCVLLSMGGASVPAFALALLLNLYLVFRLLYGSPFFFSSALDGKILAAANSSEGPDAKGTEICESERLLYHRCRRYMEEKKPFLVESFCLRDLASALATNTGYLSRVINRETGLNFRRFINGYRVKYSMDLFRRSPGLSVNDLASLSGFATSSTYYTAFQQFCHESPGSWCRRERRRLLEKK